MPAAWDMVAAHERRRAADPARRRREGAFYTPAPVAGDLAELALGPLTRSRSPADLAKLRILDPAVGGGAFLLAAIDTLVAAGLEPAAAAACCTGYDREASAVAVAAEAIAAHTGGAAAAELRVADALLAPAAPEFDAVIGNPPWEKIARDDPRKVLLDAMFAEIREGEINLHALFLVSALRSLKPGGRLAFLTPNTWLLNRWDARLRSHLLAYRIEEIAILPAGTFPDTPITVPAAIVVSKEPPGGPTRVRAPGFVARAMQQTWLARPHAAMSVFDDAALARLERAWARRVVPLGDLARASDGIYTSTARAHAFLATGRAGGRLPIREPGPSDRPILLSGGELARDVLLPAGSYIPEGLWSRHPAQACDRLAFHAARHPDLARRLVGAVVPAGTYTSNRFIDVRSDSADPFFLAAVLLSRALDGYHARRFPIADIDAFMLHQLPVPRCGPAARRRLAESARRRAALARALLLAIACRSRAIGALGEAHRAADLAIEAEVADLLGLSPAEAAWLGRRPGGGGV